MSFKEKIENNPTIFYLSILFAAFVMGIGAYRGLLEMQRMEIISKTDLDNLRTNVSAEQYNKKVQLQKENDCQSTIKGLEKQLREKESDYQSSIKSLEKQFKEKDDNYSNKQNSYETDIRKNLELISELRKQIKDQTNEIVQLKDKLAQSSLGKVGPGKEELQKPGQPEKVRKEGEKDRPNASVDNYEYKLHTVQLRSHDSAQFNSLPLIFNVLDIKKGKIYVIIGVKGYPSLRIEGAELGRKYEYNAIDHYDIEVISLADNYAQLKILEKKKIRN